MLLLFPIFVSVVKFTSSPVVVPLLTNSVNSVSRLTWVSTALLLKFSVSFVFPPSLTFTVVWLLLKLHLLIFLSLRSPLCTSSANSGECWTKILLLLLCLCPFSFLLRLPVGVGVFWLAFSWSGCFALSCCPNSGFLSLLLVLLQRLHWCRGEGRRGAAGGTTANASTNSPQRPHLSSTAQHQVVCYRPQANRTRPGSNQLLADSLPSTAPDAPSIASDGTPASALTAGLSHASKTS